MGWCPKQHSNSHFDIGFFTLNSLYFWVLYTKLTITASPNKLFGHIKWEGFHLPTTSKYCAVISVWKKHTCKKIIVRWACRHSRISYKTIHRPYFVDLRCYTENPVMEHFTIYGVIATIFYPPTLLFFFFNNLYIDSICWGSRKSPIAMSLRLFC